MRPGAADHLVAREVAGWSVAVVSLAAGLVWLTGAVESAREGVSIALLASMLRVPGVLIPLMSLLLGVGGGLAAARMETRRERVALEAAGLAPARTGLAAAAVGLVAGALATFSANHLVPLAEAEARALSPPRAEVGWVWDGTAAVRVADGLRVVASGGRLGEIGLDHGLDPLRIAEARMAQTPRTASGSALASAPFASAVVERQSRTARILAAAGLAFLGWLPWSRRPTRQLGLVFAFALSWQLLDLALQALAAQGRLAPAVGAWAATLGLVMGLSLWALRERSAGARPPR